MNQGWFAEHYLDYPSPQYICSVMLAMAKYLKQIIGSQGDRNGIQMRDIGDGQVHHRFREDDRYTGPNLLAMFGIEFTSTTHCAGVTNELITRGK